MLRLHARNLVMKIMMSENSLIRLSEEIEDAD